MDISSTQARENIGELIDLAARDKERVIITSHGKNVAAIVPIEDLEQLESAEDLADILDAIKALEECERAGAISLEEFRKKIGLQLDLKIDN